MMSRIHVKRANMIIASFWNCALSKYGCTAKRLFLILANLLASCLNLASSALYDTLAMAVGASWFDLGWWEFGSGTSSPGVRRFEGFNSSSKDDGVALLELVVVLVHILEFFVTRAKHK
jgi:hypothetical protein